MIISSMGSHNVYRVAALCLLSLIYILPVVIGHGRLIHPASRASMWRFGFPSKHDYNDNEGFCGGRSVLHNRFNGKCGVCGDPWLPKPRQHERGGLYYTGEVTSFLKAGSAFTAEVQITANHKGYFEFRVCAYDYPEVGDVELNPDGSIIEVTQSCLDKHLLKLVNGQGTKYQLSSDDGIGFFKVELQLPRNLQCKKCLFQWRYKTGNSWGVDPDGRACIGCGKQEEFKACADISISASGTSEIPTVRPTVRGFDKAFQNGNIDGWLYPRTSGKTVTTRKPIARNTETPTTRKPWNRITTTTPSNGKDEGIDKDSSKTCHPVAIFARTPGMSQWCEINCKRNFCPATHCYCTA